MMRGVNVVVGPWCWVGHSLVGSSFPRFVSSQRHFTAGTEKWPLWAPPSV